MAGLAAGAAPSITEAGPPDSTMALGPNCSILAWSTDWKGWISQYTPASRRRRAISWVTWEQKSTISRRSDMRRYKESGPPVQPLFVWINGAAQAAARSDQPAFNQRAAASAVSSGRVLKAMGVFGAALWMALMTVSSSHRLLGGRRIPAPTTTQSWVVEA